MGKVCHIIYNCKYGEQHANNGNIYSKKIQNINMTLLFNYKTT